MGGIKPAKRPYCSEGGDGRGVPVYMLVLLFHSYIREGKMSMQGIIRRESARSISESVRIFCAYYGKEMEVLFFKASEDFEGKGGESSDRFRRRLPFRSGFTEDFRAARLQDFEGFHRKEGERIGPRRARGFTLPF